MHEVLFVMMQSPGIPIQDQERYAIDLTHAQYGHHDETLMPWKAYVETRVHRNSGLRPLGWTREKTQNLMFEELGQEGLMLQIIVGQFEEVMTKAVHESPGCWLKLWKEKDGSAYQRQVEQVLQHITTRLDKFIAGKANDENYKLWTCASQKRLIEANAKRLRQQKLDLWGLNFRGSAFAPALKLIKARQAKERESWAEKKEVEMHLVHTVEGTDYKGPKLDRLEYT